jgi:NAD(P)-dependent dehydrogenase (short-subunit alcohol dehydrogenase family)
MAGLLHRGASRGFEYPSTHRSDRGKARWQGSGDHWRINRHGTGRRQAVRRRRSARLHHGQGRLGEITEEQFDAAFWLNARGTLFTVQKALPLLNDGGSIFMTGSNASLRGFPGWSVYAGSKAVQQAWARVWLAELKDRRIRVNVLTLGQVATAKQEELFDEETKRQFESLIPRGEMGRPEEIATIALFLASDDSSYVNGMELVPTAAPR